MEDIDKWKESLKNMSFEDYAITIKNKILEDNLNTESKQYFCDCFDYVFNCYKKNKPLELNLIKIYLEDIKGYKNIKMEEFIRTLLLLNLCGFSFDFKK
jgi:hypothetical protein